MLKKAKKSKNVKVRVFVLKLFRNRRCKLSEANETRRVHIDVFGVCKSYSSGRRDKTLWWRNNGGRRCQSNHFGRLTKTLLVNRKSSFFSVFPSFPSLGQADEKSSRSGRTAESMDWRRTRGRHSYIHTPSHSRRIWVFVLCCVLFRKKWKKRQKHNRSDWMGD